MSLKLKFAAFIALVAFFSISVFIFAFRSYHSLPACDAEIVKTKVLDDVKSNFEAINKVLEPVKNSYELIGISEFKDVGSSVLGNVKDCSASVSYKVSINNKGEKKQFDSSSYIDFKVEYKNFSDRKNKAPTISLSEGRKEAK